MIHNRDIWKTKIIPNDNDWKPEIIHTRFVWSIKIIPNGDRWKMKSRLRKLAPTNENTLMYLQGLNATKGQGTIT